MSVRELWPYTVDYLVEHTSFGGLSSSWRDRTTVTAGSADAAVERVSDQWDAMSDDETDTYRVIEVYNVEQVS